MAPTRAQIFSFLLALSAVSLPFTSSFAAISKKTPLITVTPSKIVLMKATHDALEMPLGDRLEALQVQGGEGYRNLVATMFDEASPMELRWRAVTAAGRLGGRESVPELERAIKRNEWYLRSAALVALQAADRNEAIKWSKKLLSDKALVVRSSAVTALVDLNDVSSTQLLWQKLYAKENFKGSQSLFIRRRIIEALTKLAQPGSEGKFVEALADKDTALHGPAIAALERLTQEHLGSATEPLNFKREHWQKWWKMRAQAKATHATATL